MTIYTQKNGEILWQDIEQTGIWGLWLIWYSGIYTNDGSTEDKLMINIEGNVKVAVVFTGE